MTGLTLSALAYYDNPLHPDPARRTQVQDGINLSYRALRPLIVAEEQVRAGGADA